MNQTRDPRDQYRLYSVVNGLYMKEIQWGIQTAHGISTMMDSVSERWMKEFTSAPQNAETTRLAMERYMMAHEWASKCPTIIVADGINLAGITKAWETIEFYADAFNLPHAKFHEDTDSLGGIMTCACFLMPANFFAATPVIDPEDEEGSRDNPTAYLCEDGVRRERNGSGKNGWAYTLIHFTKQLKLVR